MLSRDALTSAVDARHELTYGVYYVAFAVFELLRC